jgi:hypothetical protein
MALPSGKQSSGPGRVVWRLLGCYVSMSSGPMNRPSSLGRSRAPRQPPDRSRHGEPRECASREERERFVQAYADAVQAIPEVTEVRARDWVSYVEVDTFYRGDARSFEDRVFDVEAALMGQFPDVRVEWRLQGSSDDHPGQSTASDVITS